ncbi:hypothetical protein Poli38472_005972 [Pythium oligandrum]|uniref:Uncharacterized protein n=1 Tax=Pythium oligandrum TaxID=41045 RepID=A0A8K1FPM1_PYTOL|nr:hypothetical protein Poli38472_005972 [Pythium oligandrum]|eukprot:TMW68504.1 hypothetical protein Poli38472_005972 [Pythium oligandrum]
MEAINASAPEQDPTATRRRSSGNGSHTPEERSPLSKHKYDSPFDLSLAAARKRSQQEKLWEMFATYALQMSSDDPTRMRVYNVIKLLQDCGVIDNSHSEEAKMIEKEVATVCESFLKAHASERDVTKRMDFTVFLALLMHFAQMSGDQDPTRAYDSLVRTCLEKQQKPRHRVPVVKEIQDCKRVLHTFEEPLTRLFTFYATQTHTRLEKLDKKMAQRSPSYIAYAECLTFARRYGILAHGVLTTTEFATIYIDSLAKVPEDEYQRVLTFGCFCELMVRVARKICPSDAVPPDKKLKGLFQLMWLASSSTSPRSLKITDVLKTDHVDVTKHFLIHFEKFWRKENYENYVGDRTLSGLDSDPGLQDPADNSTTHVAPTVGQPKRMSRRLSLCVQTTSSSDQKDAPKTLQRRFTIQSTPPA